MLCIVQATTASSHDVTVITFVKAYVQVAMLVPAAMPGLRYAIPLVAKQPEYYHPKCTLKLHPPNINLCTIQYHPTCTNFRGT